MVIGVYWSPEVLDHKLEPLDQPGRGPIEGVWNCRHLPQGLGKDEVGDYMFVASQGFWRGCLRLVPEVLYSPEDPSCSYTLIFDVRSWKAVDTPVARSRFRGWTYDVPDAVVRPALAGR